MAFRHQKQKGAAKSAELVSGNKEVVAAAKNTKDKFKSGGKVPGRASGGKVAKRARGGRTGGSPFSSAHRSEKGNCT